MDELLIYDLAEVYADSFINSINFKRFIELSKEINNKLTKEIVSFKTAESLYNDIMKYGKYSKDVDRYKKRLIEAKTKLYSHPLMIEYKKLEFELQTILSTDLNILKKSISNKLEVSKSMILDD